GGGGGRRRNTRMKRRPGWPPSIPLVRDIEKTYGCTHHQLPHRWGDAPADPSRRHDAVEPYRQLPLVEPDRDREAAVAESLGSGMHRAHLVERIGGKEHDAVVDWRERRMCRRARGAARCDPGVVELQLPAGEALGSFVHV